MSLSLSRLSLADVPRAVELIGRVWPQTYGKTGCPAVSAKYLRWLYGGPNADRHLLLGACKGDRLLGLKALLYRPLRIGPRRVEAHLATHLTIDPKLRISERVSLAKELSAAQTISPEYADLGVEANIAFFEEGKSIAKSSRTLIENAGVREHSLQFFQYLLNPSAACESGSRNWVVRSCGVSDAAAIARLFAAESSGIALDLDPDELWHHISNAPAAAVFGCFGAGDELTAFATCYILDWWKNEKTSKVAVVEFLAAADAEQLGLLLQAVRSHGTRFGARGVTVENASCLSEKIARESGLIPAPRRMTFVLRSRLELHPVGGSFICDVK